MNTVHTYIDVDKLADIIDIPKDFGSDKAEVTVSPVVDHTVKDPEELKRIIRSLRGAIPDVGMTLDDIRMERILGKYESLA